MQVGADAQWGGDYSSNGVYNLNQMLLTVLALAFQSAMVQSGPEPSRAGSQTPDHQNRTERLVCEVLKNSSEYVGRRFTFRGVVTSYEHGMYLVPYPDCAEHQAISVWDFPFHSYLKAGGAKGVGVLATVDGKIVLRDIPAHRQKRGGPTKQTVFSVKHTSDLSSAPTQ